MSGTQSSPAEWAFTREPPDGYRLAWVVDPRWRACGAGRKCRFISGRPLRGCGRPAVAEFNRGFRREMWWAYCDRHLYGRRFWNNAVWSERVVSLDGLGE